MERRVETCLIERTLSDRLIGLDVRITIDGMVLVIILARDHFLPVIVDRRTAFPIMAFAIRRRKVTDMPAKTLGKILVFQFISDRAPCCHYTASLPDQFF